ncbi:predicted protein [Nematostella vectensis]|uniref:Protein Cryzl2 n=1 Tax=Nematostella vectensis TaxID=45351 RepID=QORL2_NEMVE|nr:RecName: Full=Quinone oxidoreductase-like protein 2 homolog [Nematostella vectensis]EDO48177.1 predicted protein [Nematostella vectensis]|eukprot:XP_001640240.1 predicted protein [Nematostella vectensis]
MAAFQCPPERVLRPLARAISASQRRRQTYEKWPTGRKSYRAVMCNELGKPLVVEDKFSTENLGTSQVRVAVHSCGINFADILKCIGKYQEKPELPFVPGTEISGEVVEVGSKVTSLSKGDRVLGVCGQGGGMAEECVLPQTALWKIPSSLSFTQAAALAISYGTAYIGLKHKANLQPGQTVLVTAAAGALGLASVDLAANVFGAKVIGASRKEKLVIVQEIGATATIDYTRENIKDKVKELTDGHGANVIMEAVGGDVFKQCLKCIAWNGYIIPVGFASGEIPQIPANILLVKNCSAVGLYWGAHSKHDPQLLRESVDKTLEYFKNGKLKGPYISASFGLDKVNEAFQMILQRKSTGKVVINTKQ